LATIKTKTDLVGATTSPVAGPAWFVGSASSFVELATWLVAGSTRLVGATTSFVRGATWLVAGRTRLVAGPTSFVGGTTKLVRICARSKIDINIVDVAVSEFLIMWE
jgi:hypothetical protein